VEEVWLYIGMIPTILVNGKTVSVMDLAILKMLTEISIWVIGKRETSRKDILERNLNTIYRATYEYYGQLNNGLLHEYGRCYYFDGSIVEG
jgi:hypothetical protein